MKYINTFKTHASYEEKLNGGGVDISLPNISYCEDVKDVHYNPYNTVEFYVGEITPPQTVKIYTDSSTSVDVTVSEGNKWYTYVLPKDKGLYTIESGYYDDESGDWYDGIVTKAIIKADINKNRGTIIPYSTIKASFKDSDTSNVTDMGYFFKECSGLTSLDVSSFDTSNVTSMLHMFYFCTSLTSLDVSSFDTNNVTSMLQMFYFCENLTSLTLSNFNTSKVTDMDGMFSYCSGLTSLDLSGWDMRSVTISNKMFNGCTSLTSIRMVGCEKPTIDKIKAQLTKDNITGVAIVTE